MEEIKRKRTPINPHMKPQRKRAKKFAKRLKKNLTKAERLIYDLLKKENIKFQYQKYFFDEHRCFIVDFYIKHCEKKLVVEIDGGYHFTEKQKKYDDYRQNWLRIRRGCEFMRFSNEEVYANPIDIVNMIIKKRKSFEVIY